MPPTDRKTATRGVPQSEGDTNLTGARAAWQARALDAETRALLAEDERYFLRQSVSTPCLNTIAKAEGIFIEDTAGRRYMDFHGNNVHHIGYGHPRLKQAITEQMDALPFAPRRYTCEPAVALARKLSEISPFGPAKVLFTTGGSDAIEVAVKIARAATGRHKTLSFWDAFHGAGVGASALSGRSCCADCGRCGARRSLRQLSLPLRNHECRGLGRRLRTHDRVRARARRRYRRARCRADPSRALRAAGRLLGTRSRSLRPPPHASHLR
jgi:4-aminobutyrate aminotransferase-like enzyme